jgi:sugar phosphate isomerase/epimerase
MKPLSIQLYTVREVAKDGNHLNVLQQIADIGYKGVEGHGYGMTPTEFRKVVEDMGMVVSSYFGGFPDPESINEFMDTANALGTKLTVSGFWVEEFESLDAIKRTADRVRPAVETLKANGFTFGLHNHWMEFELVEGKWAIQHLIEQVPDLHLEIDIYWCSAFGANNPAEVVKTYKERAHLLHVKDGPLVKGEPHVAVGSGKMNIPGVLAEANPEVTKWHVVELDECGTDMMEAVRDSYNYLVGRGLSDGNKTVSK